MARTMKGIIKIGVAYMATAILLAGIPEIFVSNSVKADWKKNVDNTCFGTFWINRPEIPKSKDSPWEGNYVYFGEYGGKPIKFRVLDTMDKSLSIHDRSTMILDSDEVLFNSQYDNKTNVFNDTLDKWVSERPYVNCSLRDYLNNDFLFDHFTHPEYMAMDVVQKIGGDKINIGDRSLSLLMGKYATLPGDFIYILDVDDVRNLRYGYTDYSGWEEGAFSSNDYIPVANRTKKSGVKNSAWWLRSSRLALDSANSVSSEGNIDAVFGHSKYYHSIGVAPALNINLQSILFSSLVSGKAFEKGAEYKLTIKDEDLAFEIPAGSNVCESNREITVPYQISGKDASIATQVTYLVIDKNADILYMDSLYNTFSTNTGLLKQNGDGNFILPSDLDIDKWGEEYSVFVFAEDVNGMKETDYASGLVELPKPVRKNVDQKSNDSATPTPTRNPAAPTPIRKSATPTPVSTVTATSSDNTKKVSNVLLDLDKNQAFVVCGSTLTLNATLENSQASITWKSSNPKVATVDSKGKITGKMAGPVTITASAAGKTVKCAVTVLYKDVTDSSKFWFEPTNYLTAKGVVKGYDKQTKFKPANDCTRAQMVTFIWRLMGEPAPKISKCKFSDVKNTDYFYKACLWGNENGIVEGYKDGTFGPQIVCARKHAVTFLWRLAGKPDPKNKTNKFSDVKSSDYFYKATLWASEKSILEGYSDGTFRPQGDCLRRQMVTFLYKYDKYVNTK